LLFFSSIFFVLLKRATWSDSLPRSLQKEKMEAARSLALYKKSKWEWLAPSLFTKRVTVSRLLHPSLQKE